MLVKDIQTTLIYMSIFKTMSVENNHTMLNRCHIKTVLIQCSNAFTQQTKLGHFNVVTLVASSYSYAFDRA